MLSLKYFRLHRDAQAPVFGTEDSACFDLHAFCPKGTLIKYYDTGNHECTTTLVESSFGIMPGERVLCPTGLVFGIPKGYSVRLHPRSGMALKFGLILGNLEGVIDSDYFYQTFIMLYTLSACYQPIMIEHGMRIAQGELVRKLDYSIEETFTRPEKTTSRDGGFGHTGI